MGEEKIEQGFKFLSLEEFERRGIKVKKNCNGLEALKAVTTLAEILLEEELKEREKVNNGEKPKVQRTDSEPENCSKEENCKRKRGGKVSESKKGAKPAGCSSDRSLAPVLPEKIKNYIINEMGGKDIRFVIQRNLFQTDLSSNHGRLMMPLKKIIEKDFLTMAEITKISEEEKPCMTKEEKRLLRQRKKIPVKVVECTLEPERPVQQCDMQFTKWYVGSNHSCSCYVLQTGWICFAARHKLKKNDGIQVWSFRHGEGKLAFAVLRADGDGQETAGINGDDSGDCYSSGSPSKRRREGEDNGSYSTSNAGSKDANGSGESTNQTGSGSQ